MAVAYNISVKKIQCPGSGTEIIPGKNPDTRIKPLPLTNGHGRYIHAHNITATSEGTLTCVRWGMAVAYNRYKFVTVSLPKQFHNGHFTSETATATCIQKCFKKSVRTSRKLWI
jgi:hypothetical protein